MTRKSTHHYVTFSAIQDVLQSRAFWEGVAVGFAPQRYICNLNYTYNLHETVNSAYDSWREVGDLLNSACRDFEHGQIPAPEADPERKRTDRLRAIAD
ncbi:hypothetical protein ACVWZM_007879 [Bradyrhizobium sp. USDA 4501]